MLDPSGYCKSTWNLNVPIRQAISAALLVLRGAVPATMRVGAYCNGFLRTTSEWLHAQRADGPAQPPQLDRDPGASAWRLPSMMAA